MGEGGGKFPQDIVEAVFHANHLINQIDKDWRMLHINITLQALSRVTQVYIVCRILGPMTNVSEPLGVS